MKEKGFNIIELMIVMAIIGILASIAVPSYSEYSRKAKRTEGIAMLENISAMQERYFSKSNRYGTLSELGFSGTLSTEGGHYKIEVTLPSSKLKYTLTATAQNAQAQDTDCKIFSLSSTGVSSSKDSSNADSSAKCLRT